MSNHAPNRARVIRLRPAAAAAAAPGPTPASGPAPKEPLWRHLVGDVLRRERLAQERTLKEVADAARISMPYLSEVERGRKEASSEVLAAAAHALGLGLADLLTLAQGDLADLAQKGAAKSRTAPAPGPAERDLGPGRAVSTGEDEAGAVMSVAPLRSRSTGTRSASRPGEVRLAA